MLNKKNKKEKKLNNRSLIDINFEQKWRVILPKAGI